MENKDLIKSILTSYKKGNVVLEGFDFDNFNQRHACWLQINGAKIKYFDIQPTNNSDDVVIVAISPNFNFGEKADKWQVDKNWNNIFLENLTKFYKIDYDKPQVQLGKYNFSYMNKLNGKEESNDCLFCYVSGLKKNVSISIPKYNINYFKDNSNYYVDILPKVNVVLYKQYLEWIGNTQAGTRLCLVNNEYILESYGESGSFK